MNIVILTGRVSTDIELRYTPTGIPVARFGLAVERELSKEKKQVAEAKGQATADFPRITILGNKATALANHSKKGKRVNVWGELRTGSYKNSQGDTVYTTEVLASRVEIVDWATNKPAEDNFNYGEDFQPCDDNEDIPLRGTP